jgi:hypothetical protein
MKKLLIAVMLFASASAVSAQTKPTQKKAEAKKECVKKCEKDAAGASCCESASKS